MMYHCTMVPCHAEKTISRREFIVSRLTIWWDRLAIMLSSLCLLHCVATVILLLAAPTLVLSAVVDEGFHETLVIAALPLSIVAMLSGYRVHARCAPIIQSVIGLACLGIAAFAASSFAAETILTIAGGLTLAAAHFANLRLRRAAAAF
jgi:hypothetical protein